MLHTLLDTLLVLCQSLQGLLRQDYDHTEGCNERWHSSSFHSGQTNVLAGVTTGNKYTTSYREDKGGSELVIEGRKQCCGLE